MLNNVGLILAKRAHLSPSLEAYVDSDSGQRLTYRIGGAVFRHVQRMSLARSPKFAAGDLIRRVQEDARCGRVLLYNLVVPALTSVTTLAVTSVVMILVEPTLWVVAVVAAVPGAVLGVPGSRYLSAHQLARATVEAERSATVEHALDALPVVQVLGAEDVTVERYRTVADRLVDVRCRLALAEGLFGLVVNGVLALSASGFNLQTVNSIGRG